MLSTHGPDGFKKSFRDEQLVAEYAVLDPDLLASCPPHLIAANGMDAFTQLLESFVSSKANPFTDALAWSGMEAVRDGLLAWYDNAPDAPRGREKMAYAALLSGITLAQVGLGSVHGLAAPLGAFFPIPHGVACGTLLAAATRVNIEVMEAREPANPALAKYARVGRLLQRQDAYGRRRGTRGTAADPRANGPSTWACRAWAMFGVSEADLPRIIANCRGSSMKTNPVLLSDAEVGEVLRARL